MIHKKYNTVAFKFTVAKRVLSWNFFSKFSKTLNGNRFQLVSLAYKTNSQLIIFCIMKLTNICS